MKQVEYDTVEQTKGTDGLKNDLISSIKNDKKKNDTSVKKTRERSGSDKNIQILNKNKELMQEVRRNSDTSKAIVDKSHKLERINSKEYSRKEIEIE